MTPVNISGAEPAVAADAQALLDGLGEPSALLTGDGVIIASNKAFRRLVGHEVRGQLLTAIHRGDANSLAHYLRHCLGSAAALVGALHLSGDVQIIRYRLRGNRVTLSSGAAILLRVDRADEERFGSLQRQVAELKREIRRRQHAEAVLEETVRERELLFRELQHRVKNNMHMLSGLLVGAERETRTPEAKAALGEVSARISAIAAVQQHLYQSDRLDTVDSQELLQTILRGARALVSDDVTIELQSESLPLPLRTAMSLALIVNELLTNALKHGRPAECPQKVVVRLETSGDKLRLQVEDNGPGFELQECAKRASGIGLVRGLLRQLGGSLVAETAGGARCMATIPLSTAVATEGVDG